MDWNAVAKTLIASFDETDGSRKEGWSLNEGQRRSLTALARRIPQNGVVIADEVGMGKTRIAVALASAVVRHGGRVAVLVPPGLGFQWEQEMHDGGVECPPLLRSLNQYFKPWDPREGGAPLWSTQSVVLLSHQIANWRIGGGTRAPYWSLLPLLYATWRKVCDGRYPRHFHATPELSDPRIRAAAADISAWAKRTGGTPVDFLNTLVDEAPWPAATQPGQYSSGSTLRVALERAVGIGLGFFDLIIIDEAHKSRGDATGLSRLLNNVALAPPDGRKLAMTATPVELDAEQWQDVLDRIAVKTANGRCLPDHGQTTRAIGDYVKAVDEVKTQPSDGGKRQNYRIAARAFERTLSPYLLRRDKREAQSVQAFARHAGLPPHAYRRERPLIIDPAELSPAWRQVVCAAEALSLAAAQGTAPQAQRLRLTMGNGHGIAKIIDQLQQDEIEDRDQLALDRLLEDEPNSDSARSRRVDWWLDVMRQALRNENVLLDHPAICRAVREIETVHDKGEKVLVFGRYTAPMKKLVELLNARQMLRALRDNTPWPQSGVRESEHDAVKAAQRQLGILRDESIDSINAQLKRQYEDLENRRQSARDQLFHMLKAGLATYPDDSAAKRLFHAFERNPVGHASVTRAVVELLKLDEARPKDWADAFVHLVDAARDREDVDERGEAGLNEAGAAALWPKLAERFDEEYSHPQGGFARLMYGETKHVTRRLLQMAFNRQDSYPRVLVAQSVVGREGLNLHKACRTVLLLHPEWNPAVVEQQIGRVDRLGSRWEQLLEEAVAKGVRGSELPRIDILPIVFQGTYDEHNWMVLKARWDALRAQLHGSVIHVPDDDGDPLLRTIADEVNDAAPDFSPAAAPSAS
ncbi:RNA polymerase-associated protein RapA [Achromobacter aegrifaciens]|uniref:helicase-related protein n=1 Tax=Achromobacter aegrifaciens TaxID=1287736 RepID=UPI001467F7B5|nr:helicase-related protein [Achromobacter aegrifaciens]CAB3815928.1 RNA polymerase-associated protein RapA [Achromobacter aegrifaciens]